ncbi:MAG: hypothetical protein WD157_01340 [Patescibacteria group bacterium]
MSPQRALSLVFVASVLLVVVSYGIWQFGRLLSPSGIFNSSDPVVESAISDFDANGNPLPNSVTDNTVPDYGINATELTYGADGKLNMARLQGLVDYR